MTYEVKPVYDALMVTVKDICEMMDALQEGLTSDKLGKVLADDFAALSDADRAAFIGAAPVDQWLNVYEFGWIRGYECALKDVRAIQKLGLLGCGITEDQ